MLKDFSEFIQAVINFFLVAAVIFFAMRAIVAAEKKMGVLPEDGEEPEPEPEPSDEVKLLSEIRDLMKENRT